MNNPEDSEKQDPERAKLETRVIAMLLGEISDFDKAELEKKMAEDPELKAFHTMMSRTIHLVQEASKPVSNQEEPKLALDKRNELLTAIAQANEQYKPKEKKNYAALISALAACLIAVLGVTYLLVPKVGEVYQVSSDTVAFEAPSEEIQNVLHEHTVMDAVNREQIQSEANIASSSLSVSEAIASMHADDETVNVSQASALGKVALQSNIAKDDFATTTLPTPQAKPRPVSAPAAQQAKKRAPQMLQNQTWDSDMFGGNEGAFTSKQQTVLSDEIIKFEESQEETDAEQFFAGRDPAESASQVAELARMYYADKSETRMRQEQPAPPSAKPTLKIRMELREFRTQYGNADGRQAVIEDKPIVTPPAQWKAQTTVETAKNPYSTFSLNVSDVSYKLAAVSLQKNILPKPHQIRSEEFLNAFDYRDTEANEKYPVAFNWDIAASPLEHNSHLIRFSIKTASEGRIADQPLNLVLLLDNSGSMERSDRQAVIENSLTALNEQLNKRDRISVITFARTATLRAKAIDKIAFRKIIPEITQLTPEGGTNIEEALDLAYATATSKFVDSGNNRIILMTDGAANLGNVHPATLKTQVETNRQKGIALDAFGIGWEDYNDDILESLTRNSNGRYAFLNNPKTVKAEFSEKLAGALKIFAGDVKVQVAFNPDRVTAYRQIGYVRHQLDKADFRNDAIDAAEIGAAESGNALYSLKLKEGGTGPIGTVYVRYKDLKTQTYVEKSWPLNYPANIKPLSEATPAMRLAAVATYFGESLANNPYAGEIDLAQLESLIQEFSQNEQLGKKPRNS